MNFYSPYFYTGPTKATTSLLSKFNISSIINGTTKTLNLVNQAIPVFKQVSPIIKNAKTMFSVINEFKKSEPSNSANALPIPKDTFNQQKNEQSNNYPTFFI